MIVSMLRSRTHRRKQFPDSDETDFQEWSHCFVLTYRGMSVLNHHQVRPGCFGIDSFQAEHVSMMID